MALTVDLLGGHFARITWRCRLACSAIRALRRGRQYLIARVKSRASVPAIFVRPHARRHRLDRQAGIKPFSSQRSRLLRQLAILLPNQVKIDLQI